jgi:hypothetical protein
MTQEQVDKIHLEREEFVFNKNFSYPTTYMCNVCLSDDL